LERALRAGTIPGGLHRPGGRIHREVRQGPRARDPAEREGAIGAADVVGSGARARRAGHRAAEGAGSEEGDGHDHGHRLGRRDHDLPRARGDQVKRTAGVRIRRALPQQPGDFARLLGLMLLAALLAVGVTFVLPPRYVAETSILLDSYSDLSSLLSLAQSSDILPGGILPGQSRKENGYSYTSIITSREILSDLLTRPTGRTPGETYMQVFAPRAGSPQRKLEVAM